MKHASASTIQKLRPLLEQIRNIEGLKEKAPGVYYLKSKAFLHFHEDGAQIFADVRLNPPDFDRLPVNTRQVEAVCAGTGVGALRDF